MLLKCMMTILDTTRSIKLPIFQVIVWSQFRVNCGVSPFSTHMNICVLSKAYEAKESLAFHRVIALLRTDRDHEKKTGAYSFICTVRGRGFVAYGVLDLLKVSIVSEINSLSGSRIHNKHTRFCVWLLHKRIKRSLMFGLSLHIFSPNSTLLCWCNLLVVRLLQVVVPPNWARKDFAHEVHLFGYHLWQNDYSYKYEIKSKTIGLHQITDITDLC